MATREKREEDPRSRDGIFDKDIDEPESHDGARYSSHKEL